MKVFSTDKYDTVSHKCCLVGVNMYEVSLTVLANFYYRFCTTINLPSNKIMRWWFHDDNIDFITSSLTLDI